MKKKNIFIIVILIIVLVLLVPIPRHLKDGGSVEYKALVYKVAKYHQLEMDYGYHDGIGIEILGIEVYNNVPSKAENTSSTLEGKKTIERIVMINGKLYYDTGRESDMAGRCGVMDGQITSHVSSTQIPTIENQSNFEGNYNYQYGTNHTIELFIDDKWIVFENRDKIYIRTYTVEHIKQGPEENSYYLTLSTFQGETVTVYVTSFLYALEIGKTYEFEFTRSGNSKDIEDTIPSIFENSNITSVSITDKIGLEQVQEPIN